MRRTALRFRAGRRAALGLSLAALLGPAPAVWPAGASLEAQTSQRPPAKKAQPARPQQAPTAARVKEIQSALAAAGFYQGEPSGKWDEKSIAAMKAFQQASGLPVTGKIDARSLQKLGLGSEIAGAAPPRPPVNSGTPQ